ncbi:MAG: hypothetical protein DI590_05955 [Methylorubrum populi]|nr:MAG: hypothetical protein DI590_05955 [Methylorubrum populi]
MPTYSVCVLAGDERSIRVVSVDANSEIDAYRAACVGLNREADAFDENEDCASTFFLKRQLREWPPLRISQGAFQLPEGISGSQLAAEIERLRESG